MERLSAERVAVGVDGPELRLPERAYRVLPAVEEALLQRDRIRLRRDDPSGADVPPDHRSRRQREEVRVRPYQAHEVDLRAERVVGPLGAQLAAEAATREQQVVPRLVARRQLQRRDVDRAEEVRDERVVRLEVEHLRTPVRVGPRHAPVPRVAGADRRLESEVPEGERRLLAPQESDGHVGHRAFAEPPGVGEAELGPQAARRGLRLRAHDPPGAEGRSGASHPPSGAARRRSPTPARRRTRSHPPRPRWPPACAPRPRRPGRSRSRGRARSRGAARTPCAPSPRRTRRRPRARACCARSSGACARAPRRRPRSRGRARPVRT